VEATRPRRISPHPDPLSQAGEGARFALDDHLFFLFTQVMGRRNRALAERLKPIGISFQQWRVLAVLDHRPGCTMGELAELASVDRTTLTRTLDGMEREPPVGARPAQPAPAADHQGHRRAPAHPADRPGAERARGRRLRARRDPALARRPAKDIR
jgi:hypothetical protein